MSSQQHIKMLTERKGKLEYELSQMRLSYFGINSSALPESVLNKFSTLNKMIRDINEEIERTIQELGSTALRGTLGDFLYAHYINHIKGYWIDNKTIVARVPRAIAFMGTYREPEMQPVPILEHDVPPMATIPELKHFEYKFEEFMSMGARYFIAANEDANKVLVYSGRLS